MADVDPCAVKSVVEVAGCSPVEGRVRWDPVHSLWNGSMLLGTIVIAPFVVTPGAIAMFFLLTGATILVGHSVGFHRRLIHRSFECPRWLDYLFAWFGTIVGMSGPLWIIRTHDLRDWAQRQPDCHPYLAHRRSMPVDAWWQMHCRLELANPPAFDLGAAAADPVIRLLERTWMAQQLPVALALYAIGGWSWVVWGVCVRVTASVAGHWYVGHLAHRRGPQTWLVNDAGVQAHDVPWAALPTMGEAWHNNHHAYPGSARIGLYEGQSDWGYAFIRVLEGLGLAWNIRLPEHLGRERAIHPKASCSNSGVVEIPRARIGLHMRQRGIDLPHQA